MNSRKNKIKREIPESSTSRVQDNEEHDLAYYIHDRVELMHQVFSVIKPKELKMMAPASIQHIPIDDLQELCTEELLGISSKRLCAILDGADPPTDTESSSSEPLETISLDSISSDDEVLNQSSSKGKKHKHKKHKSKNKHKRKNSDTRENKNDNDNEDRSKASRAGLTVLELLELQARARAIRAQLQQDNKNLPKEQPITEKEDSSDEVEIKEEPPEVVEISSEDEKPNIEELSAKLSSTSKVDCVSESSTTTERVNTLIITVPQLNTTRKIILKRNKVFPVSATVTTSTSEEKSVTNNDCNKTPASSESVNIIEVRESSKDESKPEKSKAISKQKKKQKKRAKTVEKNGSDNDEIRLQLSDSEKMDLLEDFDRKNYENFTSSDSTSSSDNESETGVTTKSIEHKEVEKSVAVHQNMLCEESEIIDESKIQEPPSSTENRKTKTDSNSPKLDEPNEDILNRNDSIEKIVNLDDQAEIEESKQHTNIHESVSVTNSPDDNNKDVSNVELNLKENESLVVEDGISQKEKTENQIEEGEIPNVENKELSEGELSDRDSIVNKADTSMEVLCISDEENKSITSKKKNKKKDKKSKKKKSKKTKQDFRESSDQNFFEKSTSTPIESDVSNIEQQKIEEESNNILIIDDDDIYEIFELSDSSCSEVDQDAVLSKEPTVEEIAAFSAKIDEIHEDIIIDKENEIDQPDDKDDIENVSWRDRYLGSNKVKKVLTTANLLNALRKKNKDLKTKLEKSKSNTDKTSPQVCDSNVLIEGSIDHFNTLEASNKYVDLVTENKEECKENEDKEVTRDMTKDAKLLLKMYKKLLKHNDMHKQRDPNKKKKKKQKKNKEKDKEKVKTS